MQQRPAQRKSITSYGSETSAFRRIFHEHFSTIKLATLLAFTTILLFGSFAVTQKQAADVYADASMAARYTCGWHRVLPGETLGYIASSYHTSILSMAHTNHIHNVNLIFVGQSLCVNSPRGYSNGMLANGLVRWYAYNSLDWSNRTQATIQIRQTARRYGLAANLLLAIAWQESGLTQHVISRDGGIGVMQIMPYTANGLNRQTGVSYNPYQLADNITLGAIYLRSLMYTFHGNLTLVISAYNEGGWNVIHRGVLNGRYVHNVKALMYRL
jgi:Transglycosylase SLT domain/LysM domain